MSTLRVEGIKNAAAASDAITFAANSSASANLSNYGRKNWIVNGGFEVHQRKDTTHSYSWCGDRFQHRAGFNKSMSLTASSGTLALAWNTVLEAGNNLSGTAIGGFFANNTKWTVSIWSTRPVKVRVDFTDGYGPTNPVAIVAAYANMTSTGETSNGFTRYKHTFDIGSNNPVGTSRGLHIGWSLVTAAADVKFTGAQLERGEYCGPYEHLSYGEYLRQCMRYYWRMADGADLSGGALSVGIIMGWATNEVDLPVRFPVPMMKIPAIEQQGGTNYYNIEGSGSSSKVNGNFALQFGNVHGANIYATPSPNVTAGNAYHLTMRNAAAFIAFNAEFG
jgi:hypothetical protein